MARPVDKQRPAELIDKVIGYVLKHGLENLSLRPLARAVGSTGRGLLYHFGSKERMVERVFAELRRRQRAAYQALSPKSSLPLSSGCLEIWESMTAPSSEPHFRLFFEAYAMALRHPERFEGFLHDTVSDWIKFMADSLRRDGVSGRHARVLATVVLVGFRGFLMDFYATHDRSRIDPAFRLWLHAIDTIPLSPSSRRKVR